MNKKWFVTYCMLILGICLFYMFQAGHFLGWEQGYNSYQPRTITKTVQLPPEVTYEIQPIHIDRPVAVEKMVYREKIEYQQLTDFASLEELKVFLAQDDTNSHIILVVDSSGKVAFDGCCEDFAFQLRDRAAAIGKRLETEGLTRSEYIKHYGNDGGLKVNNGHMINKAYIGNKIYFIEPQTDEVWTDWDLDR